MLTTKSVSISGFQVLIAQALGSLIVTSATFGVSLVLMHAVNLLGYLRVSEAGELIGLDLHEHGIPAYPEYALHPSAAPQGVPEFTQRAFSEEPASGGLAGTARARSNVPS